MEESIMITSQRLMAELSSLPPSWPRRLVFVNAPTLVSPPYASPINPLQPNEGPFRLDESSPDNRQFLQLQMWLASRIDYHQISSTEDAQRITAELRHIALGLEDLKRKHWDAQRLVYNTETNQPHPLETALEPVALMLFAPLVLLTKGLSRQLAQFILHLLYLLASMMLKLSQEERQHLSENWSKLPRTTEYLYTLLQLDSPYTGYICCPRCFSLYDTTSLAPLVCRLDAIPRGRLPPPTIRSQNPKDKQFHEHSSELTDYLNVHPPTSQAQSPHFHWPPAESLHCTYRSTSGDEVCGARLVESDGTTINPSEEFDELYKRTYQKFLEAKMKPHLSFYVANLQHWLSELATRPGMLDILCRVPNSKPQVEDIMESKAIQDLVGPDGQPFIGPHVAGVHLCLALFVDFFNSEGNFIGGKHNSTGGIFIVVLNLPIHLRYAPENMFPIFTPGGREPTTEEMNNLLRPVVEQLISLYIEGISLRLSSGALKILRAMIAIIIADTPAAKKVGGFASHAHYWFCHMCRLGRRDIELNLRPDSWPKLASDDYDAIVRAWRDAPYAELREELFKIYGLRFSELHRIPYLRLTECIGAEPMHAIMQNTIQHHIRRTFGINAAQGDRFFDQDNDESDGDGDGDGDGDIGQAYLGLDNLDSNSVELQKGMSICLRPGVDIRSLVMLSNMKVATLVTLCNNIGASVLHLRLHKGQPKRSEMVEALALKMKELRSLPDFIRPDVQDAVDCILSEQLMLAKTNKLRDLSPETLFELCSLAGMDTALLPLQRKSIFPKSDAMITALLIHRNGFHNLRDITEIISAWKSQKEAADSATNASQLAEATVTNLPHFNALFLQEIWRDIEKTEFPGELESDRPPKYLGSKQHGRLKASQWRTTCCFTMLITLGRFWGKQNASNTEILWLTNFAHLVALARIAYSYSISAADIKSFRHHSILYLEGLRSYHPSSIKPCHHLLLHIPDMMERFGPMRGWWAFPFERFNGQIQHLSTNHKVGEVEKRFLTQWHRTGKIHTVLANERIPGLVPLTQLANQMLDFHVPSKLNLMEGGPVITIVNGVHRISKETRTALVANTVAPILHNLKLLSKVAVQSREFEPYYKSSKNGFVEFPPQRQTTEGFWPVGYIHELIQYQQENQACSSILACIAQCVDVDDHFLGNRKELGARLCGRDIAGYVLVPLDQLAHVVRYSWSSSAQLVISMHNPPASLE